jgi:hypothetical protein
MKVNKKFFPEIMTDNEENYFSSFIGFIESRDEHSSMQISYNKDKYNFRIAPSHPKYMQMLFDEILAFHNTFGIHLDISKSIKTTGTIAFNIEIDL